MTKEDVINKIVDIADEAITFKIVKTDKSLNGEYYSKSGDYYKYTVPICKSSVRFLIDEIEKIIIDYFTKKEEYKENIIDEDSEDFTSKVINKYNIYIAYNKR
jgi:hypothetical protein